MTQNPPARDPLRDDLRNFIYLLWKHLGLPEPTGVQYDIATYLQMGPKRRIIQAFRGVGKSWLTAGYVLWRLYRDPNERILVVSANEDRATAFTTFVRRVLEEWPVLASIRPDRTKKTKGLRDSALSFDVLGARPHQSPSLRAAGITGQITGGRASLIVADDVEVPKNTQTQVMRDRLAELVKEFDAVLMTDDDLKAIGLPKAEVVYLGTPQTEMTLYRTLEQRGYQTRVWPARFPDEKQRAAYGPRLAPYVLELLAADPKLADIGFGRGAPVDPQRFSDLDLLEREASYGRSGFKMQYMLDPTLADEERYPLKLADLMVFDLHPKEAPMKFIWASSPDLAISDLQSPGLAGDRFYRPMFVSKENFLPYQGVIMAIDPAGRGGDELAYAIVAQLHGLLFLLRCKGRKGGYSDANLELLAREAKRFSVTEVYLEANFGDGMFSKLLSPWLQKIHPCAIEEDHSTGQKELRIIDTLEPVMNQHRLIVDRMVIKEDAENPHGYPEETAMHYRLFHQLTRITRDKGALRKDDRVDALALAVARWTQVLDLDNDKAEQAHLETVRLQELERFMDAAGGVLPRQSSLDEMFEGMDVPGYDTMLST